MTGTATISDCKLYRYDLTRTWDPGLPRVLFIGCNPSRADADRPDQTMTQILGYARSWGYGGFVICNLFAFRSPEQKDLKTAADPVGPDNDRYIQRWAKDVPLVVAAWGTWGKFRGRGAEVLTLLRDAGVSPHCLRITKGGFPFHPLYQKADLKPIPFPVPDPL